MPRLPDSQVRSAISLAGNRSIQISRFLQPTTSTINVMDSEFSVATTHESLPDDIFGLFTDVLYSEFEAQSMSEYSATFTDYPYPHFDPQAQSMSEYTTMIADELSPQFDPLPQSTTSVAPDPWIIDATPESHTGSCDSSQTSAFRTLETRLDPESQPAPQVISLPAPPAYIPQLGLLAIESRADPLVSAQHRLGFAERKRRLKERNRVTAYVISIRLCSLLTAR